MGKDTDISAHVVWFADHCIAINRHGTQLFRSMALAQDPPTGNQEASAHGHPPDPLPDTRKQASHPNNQTGPFNALTPNQQVEMYSMLRTISEDLRKRKSH